MVNRLLLAPYDGMCRRKPPRAELAIIVCLLHSLQPASGPGYTLCNNAGLVCDVAPREAAHKHTPKIDRESTERYA